MAHAGTILDGIEELSNIQISNDILQLSPEDQSSLKELNLAIEKFRKNDFTGCLKNFEEAKSKQGNLPPARLMLARLFLAVGKIPQARNELERTAQNSPQEPGVYLLFGELALRDGQVTNAALNFEKAAKLLKTGPPEMITIRTQTHSLAGLASVAERRSQWESAHVSLSAWLEVEPKNVETMRRLGVAQFHLKRFDEAEETLYLASKEDPDSEPAPFLLGRLYQAANNQKQAVHWMGRVAQEEAKNPKAQAALALWHLGQNRPQQALGHVEVLATLDAEHADLLKFRGLIAQQLGEYEQAEKHFQQQLRLTPGDFQSANSLPWY